MIAVTHVLYHHLSPIWPTASPKPKPNPFTPATPCPDGGASGRCFPVAVLVYC